MIERLSDRAIERGKGLMTSKPAVIRDRTKGLALRIVNLFRSLPRTEEARVMGRQVLRAGTSVAANYHAVCRARSKAEFVSKMGIVVEETDETLSWLELLGEAGIVTPVKLKCLKAEVEELLRIFVASQRTAKSGRYCTIGQEVA